MGDERFAAWCRDVGIPIDANVVSTWDAGRISGAEMAWQASRRAAIEEIAKGFEAIASNGLPITPEFAARQVRALATGGKQ